jgi:SnoaL-like domain
VDKQRFLSYIDHFNHKRYAEVMKLYHPDITIEYYTSFANPDGPPRTQRGLDGFLQQYETLHQFCREALEVKDFLLDGNLMAAEIYTEFHFFKDYPDFSRGPVKAGDVLVMTNWCIYTIEDDRFKRVRVAHFRMHDPRTARL